MLDLLLHTKSFQASECCIQIPSLIFCASWQVYNALGVSYVLDEKIDKGIAQFENAVKLQPGYVTAWNNLGDAYEKTKDLTSALRAFEEVLLFDPNNKIARPRRDALKDKVKMYKGVPVKSKKSWWYRELVSYFYMPCANYILRSLLLLSFPPLQRSFFYTSEMLSMWLSWISGCS